MCGWRNYGAEKTVRNGNGQLELGQEYLPQQHEPLGVRHDLRGVQRLPDVLNERDLVALVPADHSREGAA